MEILEFGSPTATTVLVQLVGDHDIGLIEKEVAGIRESLGFDIKMIAVKVNDWNADLSPWEAPAVFGKADFSGGTPELLKEVLPLCGDPDKQYYIGGYSLAGLFALWAAYQTDIFCGVAAASPSIWFPGFLEYMQSNRIQSPAVYLSLGDKESKTRNRVMATVGERIVEAHDCLLQQGINSVLEWNPGNHFRDVDLRMSKAFSKVVKMKEES